MSVVKNDGGKVVARRWEVRGNGEMLTQGCKLSVMSQFWRVNQHGVNIYSKFA